jgi:SAM-dependent methyltransferase/UDP-N-acetylglucosamine transferase subunit ALG13
MNVLVTVGMSRWPFDRLIRAITPLCAEHRVFAQIGTSKVVPPCENAPFIPYAELIERIHAADVVITHAGNTIRLVQRVSKVPIAVARTAVAREMSNDHQVEYLNHEDREGRVVAIWDINLLPQAVAGHAVVEARLMTERNLSEPAAAADITTMLDTQWERLTRNPFRYHPLRRYAYAWDELADRSGRHLDIGCGTGEFLGTLASTTALDCQGVDPHRGYLDQIERDYPRLAVRFVPITGPLPYPDHYFNSVSLLDVLEHCPKEDNLLHEIWRVLDPGGLLVLTVPRRHLFSWLDPDNAKFRFPRFHRAAYSLRFGRDVYRERFADITNDLCGDMSVGKQEHTNYRRDWLVERLQTHGFEITCERGANLFWLWFQVPALFAGPRLRLALERLVWFDGQFFESANLFLSARRLS